MAAFCEFLRSKAPKKIINRSIGLRLAENGCGFSFLYAAQQRLNFPKDIKKTPKAAVVRRFSVSLPLCGEKKAPHFVYLSTVKRVMFGGNYP